MAQRLDQLMDTLERTKDQCDHNCLHCDMFLPVEDMCFHEAEKKRKEWNEREHDRFGQLLKGER